MLAPYRARNATAPHRQTTIATRQGIEYLGASPSSLPAEATSSGDGISPAARAAASGSPPGSAAATESPFAGRRAGSGSRQRRMAFSTPGSISAAMEVMLVNRSEERRVGKEGRSRWSPYR